MTRRVVADVLERIAWTAVQAFAGSWVASAVAGLDLGWRPRLGIAASAAGLAAAKCIAALGIGVQNASTLPTDLDPATGATSVGD